MGFVTVSNVVPPMDGRESYALDLQIFYMQPQKNWIIIIIMCNIRCFYQDVTTLICILWKIRT